MGYKAGLRPYWNSLTSERRKELCRKGHRAQMKSFSAKQRLEWYRKAGAASCKHLTSKEKVRRSQRILSMTPEQKHEWGQKGHQAGLELRSSKELGAWGRKGYDLALALMNSEQRKELGRRGARKFSHSRPTWPEVNFYGLVYGNPVLVNGFTAQQSDGNGVYDGAWLSQNIIVELDGGGHHAFRDRRSEDERKDIQRLLDGNIPVRAPDENELFLKALCFVGPFMGPLR
jgi:hypothetical protein